MRPKRLSRLDCEGNRLRKDDRVRIIGLPPDAATWSREIKRFSLPVFKHLVGKYKKIAGFDKFGHAEIEFSIRAGRQKGMHFVWLEPYLLRRVQPKKSRA